MFVAPEIEPEEESAAGRERVRGDRPVAARENRVVRVEVADLVVGQRGRPRRETQLVERETLPHRDRERQRHHLEVEVAVVAGGNLVEPVAVVADDAREHIEAARRALGVRTAADVRRQAQLFEQRDEVRTVGLEHRPAPQVDLVDDEVLELDVDRGVVR